jgi:hypothetical protein
VVVAAWGTDPVRGAPGYVLSREEQYVVAARKDYVDGTRRWIERIQSAQVGKARLTFTTFSDGDGNAELNAPVARLQDVGATLHAWAAAEGLLDDTDWGRRRQAAVGWCRYSLWWQSAELTYRPPTPRQVALPYFVWKNLRLRPVAETPFLKAARGLRAALEAEPLDRAIGVFRNVAGATGPLYTVIIPGQDPSELSAWLQAMWDDRQSRLEPLVDAVCAAVEEITEGRGWERPELSLRQT